MKNGNQTIKRAERKKKKIVKNGYANIDRNINENDNVYHCLYEYAQFW